MRDISARMLGSGGGDGKEEGVWGGGAITVSSSEIIYLMTP